MPETSDTHAHTALLIMDMQEGTISRLPQQDETLTPVKAAIDAARAASIPVIYVVVSLRPGAPDMSPRNKSFVRFKQMIAAMPTAMMAVHSAIAPLPTDIVVTKRRVSAFSGSDLEVVLRAQDISHLVLCGIATSGVVLSTVREASDKDYQLTVLADCCFDLDEEVQHVLLTKLFPRQADVIQSSDWVASLKSEAV